jgi:hypothetical protein
MTSSNDFKYTPELCSYSTTLTFTQKEYEQQKIITQIYPCLHDACPQCRGTGRSVLGICIHNISCSCPKCSPTYL